MLERLLLLWLCLLGMLAYFWQKWLQNCWDPFLASKDVLNYLFAVTTFALGSLLPKEEESNAVSGKIMHFYVLRIQPVFPKG
jgi:ABC-type transport system involved in cytochrome c biogenesis permease subunit